MNACFTSPKMFIKSVPSVGNYPIANFNCSKLGKLMLGYSTV